jgi:molecular chaperone DnaJ
MPTDYYELLGVQQSATEDELKRAYRQLARELHPDTSGGDAATEARFKEVTVAYETLRDPERRRRYDMFGPDMARGQGAGAGQGDPFGFGGANLGDIFEAFFGGGGGGFNAQGRAGQRRGNDAEVIVQLTLEEAVFGTQRDISLNLPTPCETCQGTGARPGTSPTTCAECRGVGQVQRVRQSFLGQMVTTTPCSRCHGLGQIITAPCDDCRGEGRRTTQRTLTVEVPAGVDDGATLRVPGGGPAAVRGGSSGDLFVHLKVAADERFERSGNDLVTTVHVSISQASLGVDADIATLDGSELIEIPPGTQSGKVVRLGGRGVPRLQGRGRGDLLVHVIVDTPVKLSKEEDALLRQLAELRGEQVAPPDTGLFSRIRSGFH